MSACPVAIDTHRHYALIDQQDAEAEAVAAVKANEREALALRLLALPCWQLEVIEERYAVLEGVAAAIKAGVAGDEAEAGRILMRAFRAAAYEQADHLIEQAAWQAVESYGLRRLRNGLYPWPTAATIDLSMWRSA